METSAPQSRTDCLRSAVFVPATVDSGMDPRSREWDELVRETAAGNVPAWHRLQLRIVPLIERWARSHAGMRRRKLSQSPDDVREVVTATLERLRLGSFASLQKYLRVPPEPGQSGFEGWLFTTTDFAVREHLRRRFGRARRHDRDAAAATGEPSKRDLNTLADRVDFANVQIESPGLTRNVTYQEIITHVRSTFTEPEALALELYLKSDCDYQQLAIALDLPSSRDAERFIRKLKERLRIRFTNQA